MTTARQILRRTPVDGDVEALAIELGTALHAAGAPAHRVEEAMTEVTAAWGVEGRFFATPTALQAAFGPLEAQRWRVARVQPAGVALGRLAELEAIVARVAARQTPPPLARRELAGLLRRPSPWSPRAVLLATGLLGAATAVSIGGGPVDAGVAAAAAIGARLVDKALSRRSGAGRLGDLVGTAVATGLAVGGARVLGLATAWPALLGGIVFFLPGYSLTAAATEIAAGQLVSGTARLAAAGVAFLQVALGMAATASAMGAWEGDVLAIAPRPTGSVLWLAAAVEGVGFTVLLQGARRDLPRVVFGTLAATLASRIPGGFWTPLLAAALVSATSELSARRTGRPAVLLLVPGILALVPGTLGLGSLSALLRDDVGVGLHAALATAFTAVALAAGVLLGQLTARR